jgi:F-type H+-transporting ATPase subunit gamma
MPSLKAIRRRITSVKSTQQITRAMKLVAAAKLRRSQERLLALRPYAYRIQDMIASLAAREDTSVNPLLARREPKKVLLLVLTSDRGLCGSFNASVNKAAERWVRDNQAGLDAVGLAVIGKKGRDYFARRPVEIRRQYMDVLTDVCLERCARIGAEIVAEYIDQDLDAVYLVYNEFKSAIQQRVVVEPLLPVPMEEVDASASLDEPIFEPDRASVLDSVLPLHVNVQVYRAVLESVASEMGARMTAMEAATNNARDLLGRLTLQYNRARQAAITKELMEIVSGAEAQKG